MLVARMEEPRPRPVLEARPSFFRAKDRRLHIMRALMPGPRNAAQAALIAASFAPPAAASAVDDARCGATPSAKCGGGALAGRTKRK